MHGPAHARRREGSMNVNEIMTTNVITVNDDTRIEDAARLLARHRISGLPVVNDAGALVGVVTEYDLLAKQGATVAEIMSRAVISVSPETSAEDVAHLLADRRVRRVPVLDGGRLVGIVSRSDLVQQIAMHWVCAACGEVTRGESSLRRCPRCGAADPFRHEAEPPGT